MRSYFIKPTTKVTYPAMKFHDGDFYNTFTDSIDAVLRNDVGLTFMATPEMLQKYNVVAFALNGQLEIIKININLNEFDYSRTYQVNKKDCKKWWRCFKDLEEVRDFLRYCEVDQKKAE